MKLSKGVGLSLLTSLIIISLASGVQFSVSTGGNDGGSSINVNFGATIDDYVNGHVQLTPGETLSNAFSWSNPESWNDMTIHDQRYHSAKGFFDCTSCPFPYCNT